MVVSLLVMSGFVTVCDFESFCGGFVLLCDFVSHCFVAFPVTVLAGE